jgi:hypothetical protein
MVSLLHFDTRSKHAGHSLGSTCRLDERLAAHSEGRGARLLHVVQAAGITWRLARTWPGGTAKERQLTTQLGASRYCPICKEEARRALRHSISS